MSLIWADPFKSYGTDATLLLNGLYTQTQGITLVTDPDSGATGNVINIGNAGSLTSAQFRWANPNGARSDIGFAFRLWCPSLPDENDHAFFLRFANINNTDHITLALATTGQLYLYRGYVNGTLIATSTLPVITANAWHHIEGKIVFNAATGSTEVRVDGIVVDGLTLTNTNTVNATPNTFSQMSFGHVAAASFQNYNIKDFVVWDTAGTENNDFLGTVSVLRLALTGDVSLGWTPSTGVTGWNLINSAPPGSSFIEAPTPAPPISKFSFEDLPADVTSVRALISVGYLKKSDGGDCNIQQSLISGSSSDLGADRPVTTAYTYWYDVSELSPATGIAWSPVEVNAAEVAINRTL